MKSFLQVADQYYVLATSVLADHETRILKQGETFAIFDTFGDIQPVTHSEAGIFHKGTRHLSRLEMTLIDEQRPLLLNSILRDDNGLLKVDMTNPDFVSNEAGFVAKGTLYFHREKFLLDGACRERVAVHNYARFDIEIDVNIKIEADFRDIFEVRGNSREHRGETLAVGREENRLKISYLGLDSVWRHTLIEIQGVDFKMRGQSAQFRLHVPARASSSFDIRFTFHDHLSDGVSNTNAIMAVPLIEPTDRAYDAASEAVDSKDFNTGLKSVSSDHEQGRSRFCSVKTSNEQFEAWLKRSTDDLVMMTTSTPEGHLYPYAGIPWFCAAFGRDGIITALECLWANPDLARGVLLYLAATQATTYAADQDATPGKIIHEIRFGEMAALNEVPFGRYYGSIDSTLLFICLAGSYLTRTNDVELFRTLWPNIDRAIHWMDRYGDTDGDGFIEYIRENPNGLIHQGWKDSTDCVFHEDGSDAIAPIALAEVQGYAYMARREGARIAATLGYEALSREMHESAERLKEHFNRSFWLEDLGTYALALDGNKKPCRVQSSNAGQCLFTGIVKKERVARLAKTLLSPESFSGWGVRTISSNALRFNPMSYHNGSVWPHDTAMVALGLAENGQKSDVVRIFNGLFRASIYSELHRLPEVFCGFPRREGESPTLYPNACAPQAWASGSVYVLIQALLGLSIDAITKKVRFDRPVLPDSIETLKIAGLKVGDASLDIVIQNYFGDVSVQILNREGDVTLTVEK